MYFRRLVRSCQRQGGGTIGQFCEYSEEQVVQQFCEYSVGEYSVNIVNTQWRNNGTFGFYCCLHSGLACALLGSKSASLSLSSSSSSSDSSSSTSLSSSNASPVKKSTALGTMRSRM